MDIKGLFDSLYDKLVLRDLFGKAVPGMILISAVIIGVFGTEKIEVIIDKMTFPLWMVNIGFAWLLGFALQYIGELFRLLKTHPPGDKNTKKCKVKVTRDTFYNKWVMFQSLATDYEKLHAERLNVIREACGNAAMSLILAAIILFIKAINENTISNLSTLLLLCMLVLLAYCLWRMNIIQVKRYGKFVENTIGFRNKDIKTISK